MTQAAIKATYSDYRRVKGRKVLQLIFEVPIEQAPEVHKTFGEPAPDGSMWVAIARLQEPAKQRDVDYGAEFDAEMKKPEKVKRSWSELSRAEQAGIACGDADFQRFLRERYNNLPLLQGAPQDAAEVVRKICEVESRSQLDLSHAAFTWDKLYSDYQLWKRGAAA